MKTKFSEENGGKLLIKKKYERGKFPNFKGETFRISERIK